MRSPTYSLAVALDSAPSPPAPSPSLDLGQRAVDCLVSCRTAQFISNSSVHTETYTVKQNNVTQASPTASRDKNAGTE